MRFRLKRKEPPAAPAAAERARETMRAVIAPGDRFDGTLEGDAEVKIGGALTGTVRCRAIAVGPGADVDASLSARAVDIAGRVRGRIEAFTVTVAKTAVVDATIIHHRLHVETGAQVKGLRPWRPADEMARRCAAWMPD